MENPHAPQKDDALVITHYNRTLQQEQMLGLQVNGLKRAVRMLWKYLAVWVAWNLPQPMCASQVKD